MNNTRNNTVPSRAGNADRRQVKKKKESTLDPKLFVKKAKPSGQAGFRTEKTFEDLNLNPRLLSNILAKGYETLTTSKNNPFYLSLMGKI
jgi:ATP-dependent RNA helicase RhlE